jgi:hypothetical protein
MSNSMQGWPTSISAKLSDSEKIQLLQNKDQFATALDIAMFHYCLMQLNGTDLVAGQAYMKGFIDGYSKLPAVKASADSSNSHQVADVVDNQAQNGRSAAGQHGGQNHRVSQESKKANGAAGGP